MLENGPMTTDVLSMRPIRHFIHGPIRRATHQLVAIDIGTAKTVLFDFQRNEVIEEASVIVVDGNKVENRIFAVGCHAKTMVGRTTGSLQSIHPVQDGVIVDLDSAELLLKYLLQKIAHRSVFQNYEAVVALPPSSTEVERRALRDTVLGAGARYVHLVDKAVAAALGSGATLTSPVGSMIVDVGAGTTIAAIVNGGGTANSAATRAGGNRLDQAITAEVKRRYGVLIGEPTAERAKIAIGAALLEEDDDNPSISVRGRSLATGMPVEISIDRSDIVRAISEPLSMICDAIFGALRNAKPELVADIMDSGIILTGGAGSLRHLDRYLAEMVGVSVSMGAEPTRAVVVGAARLWEDTRTNVDLAVF
jgi:rod shape-determining protein MreB